ncbi:Uncharacterised protein [Streptococcus pneumoniae]|nr:Uncharacterised protein [Streptococcus pneumoniae]
MSCSYVIVCNSSAIGCATLPSKIIGESISTTNGRFAPLNKLGRSPSTVRVEKCSISRSRSIAGFVTTATLSLIKSAIFRLSVSSAASGESCPSERIGSTPFVAICSRS